MKNSSKQLINRCFFVLIQNKKGNKLKKITKGLILAVMAVSSLSVQASVSTFSRSNCYVPGTNFGWESITWGSPSSIRKTSSWHLREGDHPNNAHVLTDSFRNAFRSIGADSHGYVEGILNKWTVKGQHTWQWAGRPGMYRFYMSTATSCNFSGSNW